MNTMNAPDWEQVIGLLQEGKAIALVSDAGTPLISDPGFPLVRLPPAGFKVIGSRPQQLAGGALPVAGLPTDRFQFEGFLPAKSAARRERLQALAGEERTLVFLEASHRVAGNPGRSAAAIGGDRPAVVARELTKAF